MERPDPFSGVLLRRTKMPDRPGFQARIGSDESGKGDYFGPLVVAAVFVGAEDGQRALEEMGARDSKRISDSTALALAPRIEAQFPCEIVRINPERYNELHEKLGNLNKLLAWAHARAIENLLESLSGQGVECGLVVSDQFGDERYLLSALMKRGRKVELVQVPRAESDAAVAAASVAARAAFLEGLKRLSDQLRDSKFEIRDSAEFILPKGAVHVVGAARLIYKAGGIELLGQVAKLHFRTTREVTSAE
jgi:ribonuclease HIII